MPVDTNTEVNSIDGRGSADASLTDGFEDLSAGTTADLSTGDGAASTATLFIATEGAVDLTIEFSPDGETFREPTDESPIEFSGAAEDVALIDYDAAAVRVEASNTTGVDLDLRVTA